jgi:hypothetical protein
MSGQIEIDWSVAKLEGRGTMYIDYTDGEGETTTYTGVSLNDILDKAEPAADAESAVCLR